MAKHEFGIMQNTPRKGQRFDEYEPEKYNCISIDDIYIEDIAARLNEMDFYWHTTDICGKGIAYCGLTLIPPEAAKEFIGIIKNTAELCRLKELMLKAYEEKKWVIHYGL